MNIYNVCQKCHEVSFINYRKMFMKNGTKKMKCPKCGIRMLRVNRDDIPILSPILSKGYNIEKICVGQIPYDYSSLNYIESVGAMCIKFGFVDYDTYLSNPYFTLVSNEIPDINEPFLTFLEKVNEGKSCELDLQRILNLNNEWRMYVIYDVMKEFYDGKQVAVSPTILIDCEDEDADDFYEGHWSSEIWEDEIKIKAWLYDSLNLTLLQNAKEYFNIKSIPKHGRRIYGFDYITESK